MINEKEIMNNLIISAFEGGSNYWYRIESDTKGDYLKTLNESGLQISDYIGSQEDGSKIRTETLNEISMLKGFEIMRTEYPRHYGDAISENDDATTGDVFLQCCLFGEVIYG